MPAISIRLPDDLLKDADKHAAEMHIPRSEYIRRAIESLNAEANANRRRHRIMAASHRVRDDSMRVNAEFDAIEDAPDA
jgi:metal-responsive CopG/Arc/MetJ family transcriptional regulator